VASVFETSFARAMDTLKRVLGEAATIYRADGSASQAITAAFNEQVGAVDARRRAVFTFKKADVTGAEIQRGDWFVLEGQTDRWYVIDVRDDQSGGIEVRCDGTLERL